MPPCPPLGTVLAPRARPSALHPLRGAHSPAPHTARASLTGNVGIHITDRRTSIDFAQELRHLVDVVYARADVVVLVTDNLNTHKTACLYEAFEPEEANRIAKRIEWHYTPEHGSWLNMAEIELSVLSRQCTGCRIPDKETLIRVTTAWEKARNAEPVTIDWQFTTAEARIKLKYLYPVRRVQD